MKPENTSGMLSLLCKSLWVNTAEFRDILPKFGIPSKFSIKWYCTFPAMRKVNVTCAFILQHTELTHSGAISTTPAKNAEI